jgi:hypothetical protein
MNILIENGVKFIFASDINSKRVKYIQSEIETKKLNDRIKLDLFEVGDQSILFHGKSI